MVIVAIGFLLNRKKFDNDIRRKAVFCFLLMLIMFIIVFIPPTMWPQYWALPVGFILISLVFPIRGFMQLEIQSPKKHIWFRISCYLVGACAIFNLLFNTLVVTKSLRIIVDKDNWSPVVVHKISEDIVGKSGGKPILTLSPLYAIEGGGQIYTEFSAGVFAYRVADRLNQREKDIAHLAGLDDIGQLIENDKSDVIVLGTEPDMRAFQLYRKNGFKVTAGEITYIWKNASNYVSAR
ncbi:MAG: hypothetical protein ACFFDI_22670, partial [Promethearchaeota archaeon]